ncbi:hypothetical protein GCM10022397_06260 [Flavivirga jejuensis]
MGGGVSLGSFSGSALTEALKLLILFGKDEKGNPYKNVVIDGMSGASAGAIALTIMLRCLIDYKSMLFKWMHRNETEKDEEKAIAFREMRLESEIYNTYFSSEHESPKLPPSQIEPLKALQLAQNIQRILWVDSVDVEKLYGDKNKSGYTHNIDDSFGLLERKHMENLIAEYLMDGTPNIDNLEVLDKERVLFACSLTNILPMPINSNRDELNQLQKNVLNSTGVFNHAEVRVIDFVFDEKACDKKPTDNRWLKFGSKSNKEKPTHFSITADDAWATISASALACGAFPIAFPPVILKRFQEEYNLGYASEKTKKSWLVSNVKRTIYKNKKGEDVITEWPVTFLDIQKHIESIEEVDRNSFFNNDKGTKIDYESFNFPYVDGGTFNNEPIKEAYRIASFQDYKRNGLKTTERLVLFVDPIVRKEQFPNFNVSSFSSITGTKNTKNSTEFNKLIGSVGSLVGLLKDQGRIKEGDKIRDTKENLALKEEIFTYLSENEDIKLTTNICLKAFNKIRTKLNEDIISIGTRKPLLYFIQELRMNCYGEWKGEDFDLLEAKEKEIEESIINLSDEITLEDIYTLFKIIGKPKSQNIFASTIFRVIADVSLNTAGKNPNAINAAILPIDSNNRIIDLPGTDIEAFAGFASKESKEYAFEYGRYATLKALSAKYGFRTKKGGAYLKNNKQGDLEKIEELFKENIRATNFFSPDVKYSKDLKNYLFAPSISRIKMLLPKYVKIFWNSPLSMLSPLIGIVGVAIGAYKNIKGKRLSLKSLITSYTDEMAESVKYASNEAIVVSIIGDRFKKPWYRYLSNKEKIKITAFLKDGKKVKLEATLKKLKDKEGNKIRFHLYVIEDSKNIRVNKDGTMLSINGDAFPRLKLFTERRIPLPGTNDIKKAKLDPNLDSEWNIAFKSKHPAEIKEIKIEGLKTRIPLDPDYINNTSRTLYHSLKNLNIHVSPMLEFDVSKENGNWYFKENTKPFHEELLNRKEKS